jgi:hypothetical protein
MKIGLAYDSDTKQWSWVAGYRDEGVVRTNGTAKDAVAAVTDALKSLVLGQIGLPANAYDDLPPRDRLN